MQEKLYAIETTKQHLNAFLQIDFLWIKSCSKMHLKTEKSFQVYFSLSIRPQPPLKKLCMSS
jgi:hypothetical protein